MNLQKFEDEVESFKSFMEKNGPNAPRARGDYVSRLRYLINEGFEINGQLTEELVVKIIEDLENPVKIRTRHKSEKGIGSLGSALRKYLSYVEYKKIARAKNGGGK